MGISLQSMNVEELQKPLHQKQAYQEPLHKKPLQHNLLYQKSLPQKPFYQKSIYGKLPYWKLPYWKLLQTQINQKLRYRVEIPRLDSTPDALRRQDNSPDALRHMDNTPNALRRQDYTANALRRQDNTPNALRHMDNTHDALRCQDNPPNAIQHLDNTPDALRRQNNSPDNHRHRRSISLVSLDQASGAEVWEIDPPTPGLWAITVESSDPVEIVVTARSDLDFHFQFLEFETMTEMTSQPVAYDTTLTRVTLTSPGCVENVTKVYLYDETWQVIDVLEPDNPGLDPTTPGTLVYLHVPEVPFYLAVTGYDVMGQIYERLSSVRVVPRMFAFTFDNFTADPLVSGCNYTFSLRLRNNGRPDTFKMAASWDSFQQYFTAHVYPDVQEVLQDAVSSLTLVVEISPFLAVHVKRTLTLTATRTSDNVTETLTQTVIARPGHNLQDHQPPTCTTTSTSGGCQPQESCDGQKWSVSVVVTDNQSGIKSAVFVDPDPESFNRVQFFYANKSASAEYMSTCCVTSALLLVHDYANNPFYCTLVAPWVISPPTNSLWSNVSTNMYTGASSAESTNDHTPFPVVGDNFTLPTVSESRQHSTDSGYTPSVVTGTQNISKDWSSSLGTRIPTDTIFQESSRRTSITQIYTRIGIHPVTAVGASVAGLSKSDDAKSRTLRIAAIVCGSVGGAAGLAIAVLCVAYRCVYLRRRNDWLRRRRSGSDVTMGSSSESRSEGSSEAGSLRMAKFEAGRESLWSGRDLDQVSEKNLGAEHHSQIKGFRISKRDIVPSLSYAAEGYRQTYIDQRNSRQTEKEHRQNRQPDREPIGRGQADKEDRQSGHIDRQHRRRRRSDLDHRRAPGDEGGIANPGKKMALEDVTTKVTFVESNVESFFKPLPTEEAEGEYACSIVLQAGSTHFSNIRQVQEQNEEIDGDRMSLYFASSQNSNKQPSKPKGNILKSNAKGNIQNHFSGGSTLTPDSKSGGFQISVSSVSTQISDSRANTPTHDSRGGTPTPNSRDSTSISDSRNVIGIPSPDSRGATPTPDSRGATPTPNSRGATPTPDSRGATPTPNSRGATPSPNSRGPTPTRNSRDATPTPNSRGVTPTPDIKHGTSTSDSRCSTQMPNSRNNLVTSDSRINNQTFRTVEGLQTHRNELVSADSSSSRVKQNISHDTQGSPQFLGDCYSPQELDINRTLEAELAPSQIGENRLPTKCQCDRCSAGSVLREIVYPTGETTPTFSGWSGQIVRDHGIKGQGVRGQAKAMVLYRTSDTVQNARFSSVSYNRGDEPSQSEAKVQRATEVKLKLQTISDIASVKSEHDRKDGFHMPNGYPLGVEYNEVHGPTSLKKARTSLSRTNGLRSQAQIHQKERMSQQYQQQKQYHSQSMSARLGTPIVSTPRQETDLSDVSGNTPYTGATDVNNTFDDAIGNSSQDISDVEEGVQNFKDNLKAHSCPSGEPHLPAHSQSGSSDLRLVRPEVRSLYVIDGRDMALKHEIENIRKKLLGFQKRIDQDLV